MKICINDDGDIDSGNENYRILVLPFFYTLYSLNFDFIMLRESVK